MIPNHNEVLPNLVGTLKDQPVFDESGYLLADLRVLIQTECGVRQVLLEGWCSFKLLHKGWTPPTRTGLQRLLKQPSVHMLYTVGQVLSALLAPFWNQIYKSLSSSQSRTKLVFQLVPM
jgi:hypothetical protein